MLLGNLEDHAPSWPHELPLPRTAGQASSGTARRQLEGHAPLPPYVLEGHAPSWPSP